MVKYTKDALAEQALKNGWTIGDHTYGVPAVQSWGNDGKLRLGKYCSIAGGVKILLGGNHRTDWVTTYPFSALRPYARHMPGHPQSRGDVVIGNDVWIGQGCTILSGVSIGDGACLAAESLVARDIPPYAVVGGNPAKLIRMRFSEERITRLLAISWWDWTEQQIEDRIELLLSDDIDAFIASAAPIRLLESP